MPTHKQAIQMVLDALVNPKTGAIASLSEIDAVGHRVVHGGEKFAASTLLTPEVLKTIEECNDLAPLHNPANLIGIDACKELMPNVPMVGVFDTAFHQTMPRKHISMVCLMSIMRNTRSEDTVSTEQATALYLSVPQSSLVWILKIP